MFKISKYLIFIILVSITSQGFTQTRIICNAKENEDYNFVDFDLDNHTVFDSTQQAHNRIENLLKKVGLPMNFHVRECSEINCTVKKNAFATVNKFGTRFIVYDKEWFHNIDSSPDKIKSLTILAHELGHHLAAHTLFFNDKNHSETLNICSPKSNNYDKENCKANYHDRYMKYLSTSRKHELEADRFAGYIMSMNDIELKDVLEVYYVISKEIDDKNSTHPRLSRRVKAVTEGYNLAREYKIKNKPIDLRDIKGNSIEISIEKLDIIERNQLLESIKDVVSRTPIQYIRKNSKISLTSLQGGRLPEKVISRMLKYNQNTKSPTFFEKDSLEYEIFISMRTRIQAQYDSNLNYDPYAAIHIKSGYLFVISFEKEVPFIIYNSKFNKEISLKEIETLMIELYENGFNKAIKNYENDG